MLIENGQKVLFIGDSITHWYSNWAVDGEDLGIGYVSIVARSLTAAYNRRGDRFQFVNRGWSGDRVRHLVARWKKDCLDHRPDWISLYIGVNNCFDPDATPETVFAEQYEGLLRDARAIGARIIVVAPFMVAERPDAPVSPARKNLLAYLPHIERLAGKYAEAFVPLHPLFATVSRNVDRAVWTKDGIHPTLAGHGLIADAWMKAVGAVEL